MIAKRHAAGRAAAVTDPRVGKNSSSDHIWRHLVSKTASFWAAAAIAVGTAAPVGAQEVTDHVRSLVRQALQQSGQNPTPADAAGTLLSQQGPTVDLTVDEAVARALERNLDIRVERLNPRLQDFTIAALEANYRPNLTSLFSNGSRVQFTTSQTAGADRLSSDTIQYNGGIAQNLKWGGGSYTVGFTNRRVDSSNLFATRNPSYNSDLNFAYVQPLLRGFKIDNTRAQLRISTIQREINEVTLQTRLTNTLANVRNAYWDLVYAIRATEVARRSLELSSKLVEDNRARVEIGTLAPIDIVQAQAEEANRRQALAAAEATRQTAELTLKRLIVSGTDDPMWRSTINPVDQPSILTSPIDLEAAVARALGTRTDVLTAQKQLEQTDVTLKSLVNLTLPALDLQASYGLTGLGGTQFVRQGNQLGAPVSTTVPGGYFDAIRNITGFDAPAWNLQLNLSYPIGRTAAEANHARAKLQRQQTEAQLKALELTVATEVTNAALTVQSGLQRMQAATVARELAEKRLEAEQSKFDVGMSTNYQVVQAQRDLRDALNIELQAILAYNRALVDFERSQSVAITR
jgi:outer membrane protein